jgi:hypothetical protein
LPLRNVENLMLDFSEAKLKSSALVESHRSIISDPPVRKKAAAAPTGIPMI